MNGCMHKSDMPHTSSRLSLNKKDAPLPPLAGLQSARALTRIVKPNPHPKLNPVLCRSPRSCPLMPAKHIFFAGRALARIRDASALRVCSFGQFGIGVLGHSEFDRISLKGSVSR